MLSFPSIVSFLANLVEHANLAANAWEIDRESRRRLTGTRQLALGDLVVLVSCAGPGMHPLIRSLLVLGRHVSAGVVLWC